MATVTFDRGTLSARDLAGAPGFVWDPRTATYRAPAHSYGRLTAWAREQGVELRDEVSTLVGSLPSPIERPGLRSYQEDAIRAWKMLGSRGVVVMPTGAGKTRVALAAIADSRVPAAVLCPTRALVTQWRGALKEIYGGAIGIASDGEQQIEAITVMTFESAYRHLDRIGAVFGLLIVDEVHHFASGVRAEALECSPAPRRLGLTATGPARESEESRRLTELMGPVVFELSMADLVGKHLAPMDHIHLAVDLDRDERERYDASYQPFASALRAYRRTDPGATWQELMRSLSSSAEGRAILAGYLRAEGIALFPRAKADLVSRLLSRHARDKALAFVARADDAYAISIRDLVPIITAETKALEREGILAALRANELRAIVSARVLNEGIDLPDADVAILVAGKLGKREIIQRIGRVLRPREGKRARVYTLCTRDTIDERRFTRSWGDVAHT